jgi:uncharacterized protein
MHRREGKLIYSATDLVGFLECGHLTLLDRAVIEKKLDKPPVKDDDPALELLRRRGWQHEERYIAALETRIPPRKITRLDGSYDRPTTDRARETEEAMRRGDDVIFQATVFDGEWVGHPDFLLRVGEPGELGKDHHYEVADTKLAHVAKASALLQIASYVEQIERIQGVPGEHVYVVTGGAEIKEHEFRTAELMAYYRHAKARFEREVAKPFEWPIERSVSYPDPVEHCGVCQWFRSVCRVDWRRDDALPLVAGINRRQRDLLEDHAIETMTALAQLPGPPITLEGVKSTQAESLWRMREQARLQVKTAGKKPPAYELLRPELDADGAVLADRGLSALPDPSQWDLFFDIEGDPFAFWEGLEYLFGIWDGAEYRQIWAMDRTQEKQAFEQVIALFHERWQQHPEMHIYHYGAYEPSRLKSLAGRHATCEEELDQLLRARVFVDLYRVVRQGVIVGADRYSIKNLEDLYDFQREIELRDANSSIVEFEKLLEFGDPNGELKVLIAGYNKDDTVSTQKLRDWLEQRRLDAERDFDLQLRRPVGGKPEPPSEELSDRIRAVRQLEERLTANIPKADADQTDTDKQTWLVAHLLDWHRREDKSTYWRYFDLMSKSDNELIEEAEPIGGLELISHWSLPKPKRSDIYRYKFPAQDYKIGVGDSLNDPALLAAGKPTATGDVHAIDEDALTIDVRRPRDWHGPHPTSVVALDVIDAKAQRQALMRLGEWVAVNGIASESAAWRAGRDLLRRLPPRLLNGERLAGGGTEAARRLALLLDGTTLAIQGPPGSGKTYTGARMIVELVRAQRKVAITSNSHKVISNLLAEVMTAAEKSGVTVRAVQKGKEHEALRHPAVKRVEDNDAVAQALLAEEVDVAAGTPWLFAREEMAGLVDTLFVDEAGQVSLANVVAISGAARNLVLLGDPQQLEQPTQGVHPPGAGASALGHYLGEAETLEPERGLFLERTYRMHPQITQFTSQLFYEGKLRSVEGLERQRVLGDGLPAAFTWLGGSGLRWVPVEHDDNTNESEEEAERVTEIVRALIGGRWVNEKGIEAVIGWDDILVISPYNAQRVLVQAKLGAAARVGTVDKFQGQQAPVSIYTMATSRPEDAPRGMDFLYSLNRLNVATSRARALSIVVASPRLLDAVARTPAQVAMANALCTFAEMASPATVAAEPAEDARSPLQLTMALLS